MWIRSQNKEVLIKIKELYIEEDEDNEDNYDILANEQEYLLGTYNTKERAIEVLNEIQEEISCYQPNKIYEMPDEDDLEWEED